MTTAWILDAVRTPRGRGKPGKGALSGIHPQILLAQTANALVKKSGIGVGEIEDVVIGCVSQAGEQGANVARNAILYAGWPDEVTGVTLNRFCGSGLQALNFAAMGVMSGQNHLVVAGGVESMSRCPMGSDGGGIDGGNELLRKRVFQVPQGISADLIATLEGFSREDVDRFALSSQEKAEVARKEGRFLKSLVPVRDPETGDIVLERDEHPRPETTLAGLRNLAPSFLELGEKWDPIALRRYPEVESIHHVHTAGNSSGIVDGAALVLLASDDFVKAQGLSPRARIRSTATFGSEPVIMLTAPSPASERALKRAGMAAGDIDLWEVNEAFAAVPLQTTRKLGIDPERVNVNGGAIALGHPLGATGAALFGTALDELERRGETTALVTLCIGGGMGIATILERT